jgi:eukaryotic-like serine/threonine-protein kinase
MNETGVQLSLDDASKFGFDLPENELIERLRLAADGVPLGRLGGYELLSVAGRGGQGVVFKARQPNTGRNVALKRVGDGSWAASSSRWRFAREVEVEASLRHPNIVSVYGVEIVEGQPLLALEWIDGVPLDRWASPVKSAPPSRSVAEVLAMFLRICDAVHHAHQRGVIHRDLKPSNILVDATGEPHVLDFGLAKLITGVVGLKGGEDARNVTVSGDFLGTLAYAAPEQVRCDPDGADVRTDVFALGGMLYECLTGRAPFGGLRDLEAATRAICSEDPERPSMANRTVDADLDAIVLRCLAKERERRYQSVEALGADLGRYVAGAPVEARASSTAYLVRKFVRRNRALVAASAAGVLCLSLGATAATWQAMRAREQAHNAAAVNDLLINLIGTADPFATGKPLMGVDLLDSAAKQVDSHFRKAPEREAAARIAMANAYFANGVLPKAEEQARAGWNTRRRVLGDDHLDTLEAAHLLGRIAHGCGRYAYARELFTMALEGRRRLLGPLHRDTLSSMKCMACALHFLGEGEQAEELARFAASGTESQFGPGDRDSISAADTLGLIIMWNGRPAEAEPIGRGAAERASVSFGARHPGTLIIRANWAASLWSLGRLDEAEAILLEDLAVYRAEIGEEHPDAVAALEVLGVVRWTRGEIRAAEEIFRRIVEIRTRVLGPAHARTLIAALRLLHTIRWRDGANEVLALAQHSHQNLLATMGPDYTFTRVAEFLLAEALTESGDAVGGEAVARAALARSAEWTAAKALAAALRAQGRAAEGEELLSNWLESTDAREDKRPSLRALRGGCLADLGRLDEADAELRTALAQWKDLSPSAEMHRYLFPEVRILLYDLIDVAERRGDAGAAAAWRAERDDLLPTR